VVLWLIRSYGINLTFCLPLPIRMRYYLISIEILSALAVLCFRNTSHGFFGYLPLYSGSVYISGLTVYLSGNGIIRLEAYFTETSQLSGSRNSCPKYFPLHPSERIAYAWLRIANSRSPVFAAPALTVSGIHMRYSLLLIYLRRFKQRSEEVACSGHMFSLN
jgi:hypothetical protein